MKKLTLPSEIIYLLAIVLISFGVAMTAASDFGVSMIAAPALILSMKTGLSYGICEYLIQSLFLIAFVIIMGKIKITYFMTFLYALMYGGLLDLWRAIIPDFNPAVAGTMDPVLKHVYFVVGVLLTTLSVAITFRTYLYPTILDLFVKGLSLKFGWKRNIFKLIYDFSLLAVSVAMTLIFFGEFRGIGIGTIVITVINAPIITLFDKILEKCVELKPLFPKLEKKFDIQ